MVISFLVLWSICLSSSQVHFKNDPEYLTRGTTWVFITLIRILLYILTRVVFWFSEILFLKFFLWSPLQIFPSISIFPFLRGFWFFLGLVVWFIPSCVVSRFSLLARCIFLCQIQFLYLDCIFSLIIIIIIYSFRVFHLSVSWWFSQEFEWQQVSSSLQDSSQYTGRLQ